MPIKFGQEEPGASLPIGLRQRALLGVASRWRLGADAQVAEDFVVMWNCPMCAPFGLRARPLEHACHNQGG